MVQYLNGQLKKRYKHFVDLHKSLLDYVKSYMKKSERIVNEYPYLSEFEEACFPIENDRIAFIRKSSIEERCVNIRNILRFFDIFYFRKCYKII